MCGTPNVEVKAETIKAMCENFVGLVKLVNTKTQLKKKLNKYTLETLN